MIGLALLTVMAGTFLRITNAGRLGSGRIANQLRARQAVRRIVPMLRFATAPNSMKNAIYYPDTSVAASNVVFALPENYLDPGATPFDPRSPVYYLYQLRHDNVRQKLILEDFYNPAQANTIAIGINAFNVTRTHPNGLVVRIGTQSSVRDEGGRTRTIDYQIDEAVEIPQ